MYNLIESFLRYLLHFLTQLPPFMKQLHSLLLLKTFVARILLDIQCLYEVLKTQPRWITPVLSSFSIRLDPVRSSNGRFEKRRELWHFKTRFFALFWLDYKSFDVFMEIPSLYAVLLGVSSQWVVLSSMSHNSCFPPHLWNLGVGGSFPSKCRLFVLASLILFVFWILNKQIEVFKFLGACRIVRTFFLGLKGANSFEVTSEVEYGVSRQFVFELYGRPVLFSRPRAQGARRRSGFQNIIFHC